MCCASDDWSTVALFRPTGCRKYDVIHIVFSPLHHTLHQHSQYQTTTVVYPLANSSIAILSSFTHGGHMELTKLTTNVGVFILRRSTPIVEGLCCHADEKGEGQCSGFMGTSRASRHYRHLQPEVRLRMLTKRGATIQNKSTQAQ